MSDTIPTVNMADLELPTEEELFAKGFKNITGVPVAVARSIQQRVTRMLTDRKEFEEYVMRARMQHLLVQDYQARNAPDPEERKKAAETFLKLSDAFVKKPAARKK